MAKSKKRYFMSEDRNELIRSREIQLNITDEDIELMNKTELIQVGNLTTKNRLHHGLPRDVIIRGVKGKLVNNIGPVDPYRGIIERFLRNNWNKIKEQIGINCSGTCYKCSDMTTLSCYIINSALFERIERKENGKTEEEHN